MQDGKKNVRMPRKQAMTMEELVSEYIRQMKLTPRLNRERVYSAWAEASGASRYTLDRNFRNGVLYVTIGSSMVRNQLYFQKDVILEELNRILEKDELFDGSQKDAFVKYIVLK